MTPGKTRLIYLPLAFCSVAWCTCLFCMHSNYAFVFYLSYFNFVVTTLCSRRPDTSVECSATDTEPLLGYAGCLITLRRILKLFSIAVWKLLSPCASYEPGIWCRLTFQCSGEHNVITNSVRLVHRSMMIGTLVVDKHAETAWVSWARCLDVPWIRAEPVYQLSCWWMVHPVYQSSWCCVIQLVY